MTKWLLESQDIGTIREALVKLYPEADANKVLATVSNNFTKLARTPFDALLGWCLSATKNVHRLAIETGDYALALAAVKQVCALAKEAKRNSEEKQETIDLE